MDKHRPADWELCYSMQIHYSNIILKWAQKVSNVNNSQTCRITMICTNLVEDNPMYLPTKFGSNWARGFREEVSFKDKVHEILNDSQTHENLRMTMICTNMVEDNPMYPPTKCEPMWPVISEEMLFDGKLNENLSKINMRWTMLTKGHSIANWIIALLKHEVISNSSNKYSNVSE